jgi:photosystem II stability/assembly factor-like uncharacterized protein
VTSSKVRMLAVGALVAVALLAFAQGPEETPRTKGKRAQRELDSGTLIRHRISWFYRQRAYPLERIPAFARLRAWQQWRELLRQQRQMQSFGTVPSGPTDPPPVWTLIGPQPTQDFFFQPAVSGRVNALVVDPCDSTGNTVFLGGAQGGVWLTQDGGQHWTPLTDDAPSLAVGSLAIAPNTCSGTVSTKIYVGTGEENFSFDSYYGAGLLICTTSNGWASHTCTPDQTFGAFSATTQPLNQSSGGPFIGSLAVSPQNSSVLLAAVQGFSSTLPSGIWCSSNGGMNWTRVLPAQSTTIRTVGTSVVFDRDGTAYAAIGNLDGGVSSGTVGLNGVYRSQAPVTSCNVSFIQLTLPVSSSQMGRIALAVGPPASGTHGVLFAAIASASSFSNDLLGVFRSLDGGNTWAQSSGQFMSASRQGFCDHQCFYDLVITVNPVNPSIVLAGGAAPGSGATLIESTDGGTTWQDVAQNSCSNCFTGLHVDTHAIAFRPTDGALVYVGTDGGVWSSPISSVVTPQWTNLNATLALSQFYPGMSAHPSGFQFRSFGGTQDNGMQRYSGVPLWADTLSCGDGGFTLVDPLIPSTVFGVCAYVPGSLLGIFRSLFNGDSDNTQGTTTFFPADAGIVGSDDGNFIPPLTLDPQNPQRLYFGTVRVWQSVNDGASWAAISPDVTGAATNPSCGSQVGCVLTALAVAPTDSSRIATGSSIGHVAITVNGGQSWTDLTAQSPLPNRSITQVAFDPTNSNLLYVTFSGFSGFNGDTAGHVFLGTLTVAGSSVSVVWQDLSTSPVCPSGTGNLPNIPVNDIVVDPDHSGQLYVATDLGVLQGNLQAVGACWQPLGTGLPNVAVLSLKLHEASRTLIAGTHGRSAWALTLGDVPAFHLSSLSPASANAGAGSSLSLVLTGTGFTSSSTVNWSVNGNVPAGCSVTVNSQTPTQLNATVSPSCMAAGGLAQVSVSDPNYNPSMTNGLPFTILSKAPTVNTISPTTASAPAQQPLTLTLSGSGFLTNTTVALTQLLTLPSGCVTVTPPSSNNATSLTATVDKSCLQFGGIFFVTANNPPPGGGSSNPNFEATTAPGAACSGMNPPGCLLTVTGPTPPNDDISAATVISSNTFSVTEDTSGATTSPNDPALPSGCTTGAANNGAGKSVWFKITPAASLTAEVDTIGSNYDTILSVWALQSASAVPQPGRRPAWPAGGWVWIPLAALLLLLLVRRRTGTEALAGAALGLVLTLVLLSLSCGGGGGSSGSTSGTGGGSSATTLASVACNDDIIPGVSRVSQLSNLHLSGGTTYFFMVSAFGVPIQNSSGQTVNVLADGGKLVFNFNGH